MKEKEIDLFDMIKVLWKRKWTIFSIVFLITSFSIVVVLFLTEEYKANVKILPQTQSSSPLSMLSGLQGMSFTRMFGGDADQFKILAILKSRTLKDEVIKKFDLVNKYDVKNLEEARKRFGEKNMKVKIGDEMQININIWDENQEMVAEIANYVAFCLDSINIAMATNHASEVKQFLEKRVNTILDEIYQLENETIKFMQEHNIIDLDNQVFVGLDAAGKLKSQILSTKLKYKMAQKNLRDNNAAIKSLKYELDVLKSSLEEQLLGMKNLTPSFKKVPELGIKIEELKRKVEYYTTVLQYLGPQYEQAKIDEKKNVPTIQILDKAVKPERKDRPSRSLIVIAVFLASGLLSCGYVLVSERNQLSSDF